MIPRLISLPPHLDLPPDKRDIALSSMEKQLSNAQTSGDAYFSQQPLVKFNVVQTKEKIAGTSEECILNSSKLPQRRGGIDISREELKKVEGMKRNEAAQRLKVSVSTFKRICRDYGISRWPPREGDLDRHSCSSNSTQTTCTKELGETAPTKKTENIVTIKAKYGNKFIKFELPASSGMEAFYHQVSKRLELEAKDYNVSYQDDDDDSILLKCDDDLQLYISSSTKQGNCILPVFIEPSLTEHHSIFPVSR